MAGDEADGRRLADEDTGRADGQPTDDAKQTGRQRQHQPKGRYAECGQQGAEKTEADDETTGQGRDDDTEQIDTKDVGKTRDREIEGGRNEQQVDVGERADEGEQHAEADRAGREQLEVAAMLYQRAEGIADVPVGDEASREALIYFFGARIMLMG